MTVLQVASYSFTFPDESGEKQVSMAHFLRSLLPVTALLRHAMLQHHGWHPA